jgi:hypothetical protein
MVYLVTFTIGGTFELVVGGRPRAKKKTQSLSASNKRWTTGVLSTSPTAQIPRHRDHHDRCWNNPLKGEIRMQRVHQSWRDLHSLTQVAPP